MCPAYKIVNTHNIPIDFPVDSGYNYKGPVINFDYFPECEEGKEDTSECKMRNVDLNSGTVMDSPLMLDQALQTMDQGQLEEWILKNTNPPIDLSGTTNTLQFAQIMPINYDQGAVYNKCVKGDWWAFWEGTETVPCLKIKGHGYTDYGPNFCYEKKWDSASVAEVSIIAGEVVAGVVAGAVAGFFSGGAGALPAYCVTSVGVSAVGAWALAGTMSEDKWPGGINQ